MGAPGRFLAAHQPERRRLVGQPEPGRLEDRIVLLFVPETARRELEEIAPDRLRA